MTGLGDSSMMELFRQELEAQTEVLNARLIRLERDPARTEHVDEMMRAAHSVKGAARLVGLDDAVRLAHSVEDCFVALGAGRIQLLAEHCDDLLACVDLLQVFGSVTPETDDAWLTERAGEVDELVRRIRAVQQPAPAPPELQSPAPKVRAPRGASSDRAVSGRTLSMWDVFRSEAAEPVNALANGSATVAAGHAPPHEVEACARAGERVSGLARLAGSEMVLRAARVAHRLMTMVGKHQGLGDEQAAALVGSVDFLQQVVDMDQEPATALGNVWGHRLEVWERLLDDATPEVVAAADRSSDSPRDTTATTSTERQSPVRPTLAEPVREQVLPKTEPVSTVDQGRELVPRAPSSMRQTGHGSSRELGRFVRVTSENLDRLMGLAADTLVQVNWLQPYADSLVELKRGQESLGRHLDALREISSETVEDRAGETVRAAVLELTSAREVLNQRLAEIEEYARRSVGLSDRLYHEVIDSRMRPLADGLRGLPRLVRDLARQLGKNVHLELSGEETEVDRDILERLESPLNHLLRNAVDHGIESPTERIANGKPSEGHLRLEAAHRGGMLSIQLVDDGRGIDVEALRAKVVAKGLVTEEAAQALTDDELIDFLFTPGFSTATHVTEVSGRGVGLDVVRATVGEVGGSIHAITKCGEGTRFQLELPLTLSVVRTLLVRISGETYAVPLTRVEQVLRLDRDETFTVQNRLCCTWNGNNVGLVPAALVLELPATEAPDDTLNVVCVKDRSLRYGICVDELLGEQNLVVRPLDSRLGKVPDVSAAAVMSDGSLVIILDVDDMVRSIGRLKVGGRLTQESRARQSLPLLRKRVLVADDSIPVRDLETRVLEREGFEVATAVDGEDAWAQLAASHFDLLVSDVDMPKLNGFKLVQRVRSSPTLTDLPIVLVSYNETDEYRREGLAHGANRYVTKSQITTGAWIEAVIELIGSPVDENRNRQ